MPFGRDRTGQWGAIEVENFRGEADDAVDYQAGYQTDGYGEGEEVDECLVHVSCRLVE